MIQIRNDIIALHMHGDIALNGCECMVGKSTLRLVFDWVGLVKSDNIQQSYTVEYDVCFYLISMKGIMRVLIRYHKKYDFLIL